MIHYRQATRAEFDLAVSWAAAEGWNPGLSDADIFWATDPSGFVCAERDGELIATGSIVRYGEAFGFMGFFIVRPDLRGQGIGREFWYWRRDMLRERLRPDAPIGMDGVFNMQPFYAKGGFQLSHRNLRMGGIAHTYEKAGNLVALRELPFTEVCTYDQRHFGFDREPFLKQWIDTDNSLSLGSMKDTKLSGIGTIRRCQQGYKIGPLFADDAETAEQLFCALSNHAAGNAVYLDIPENNPSAQALASKYQLQEVFGCARMYHGATPTLPWENIFGITTFELG